VYLDRLRPTLGRYDVVVINRFVRTHLGRGLRAACGPRPPWRACTGTGRQALTRAIEGAALWVSSLVLPHAGG
jgi:hypothetical protein